MKLSRPNSFPGKCCICEGAVSAQAGYLVAANDSLDPAHHRGRKKWLVFCKSSQCVAVFAGQWTADDVGRRELCEDGTIVMPFDAAALPLIQSIATASRDGRRWTWTATRNVGDRARVLEVAQRLGLSVHRSWHEVSQPPEVADLVARAERDDCYQHQVEGVQWISTRPRGPELKIRGCILADDMGLGKTRQALYSVPPGVRLVVLCPANAKATWEREPAKWLPDRFTSVHVCEGNESFRWPSHPGEIVVANYEIAPFTPAEIRKERERLLAKRHGRKPNPQGKTKAERLGRIGLLEDLDRVVRGWRRVVNDQSERGKRLRLFRELAMLAGWLKLCRALYLNHRALNRNAKRRPIKKPPFRVWVALDEAHYVSNTKARRTKNASRITKFAELTIGLTGTPVEADPLKLYGLLSVCRCPLWGWDGFRDAFNGSKGEWGGTEFLREATQDGTPGPIVLKPGTADQLRAVVLRRTKDEVLDLPPKIFSEIIVPVSRELLEELDTITAECIDLILDGKLPPFARISEVRKALELARIDRMLEEISEYEQQQTPLVVFGAHRGPIEALKGRAGWAIITGDVHPRERREIEDAFQAGKLAGVAGTIGAMATSITLTRASHELFVGQSLRRSDNLQAQDRCHRISQTRPVNITIMVSDHVLDQHCADLLAAKDVFVQRVLEDRMQYDGVDQYAETREEWLSRLPPELREQTQQRLARMERIAKRA